MSPRNHPDDDALLAYTTGAIPPGGTLVIALHLVHCAHCRSTVRFLDTLGGALVCEATPEPLRSVGALPELLDRTTIEPDVAPVLRAPAQVTAGIRHGPWKPFLPGVELADVEGDFEAGETVCLLKGKAGSSVPEHTHRRVERFVVLEGGFGLDQTAYHAGDYIEADHSVTHTPFIPAEDDCLCLFALEGRLIFTDPSGGSAAA